MELAIADRPSPNFNDRQADVSILVLHYTGMDDAEAAIDRLADPDAKVSSHYVVAEDGAVTRMVDEDKRAWHAGAGFWNGVEDVNSASIGVEIVNGGHCYGLPEFPRRQIDAVIALSDQIVARWGIRPRDVIGHSDLAPERKLDPGERFPWARLADHGIGLWPDPVSADHGLAYAPGLNEGEGLLSAQRLLFEIGYGIDTDGVYGPQTRAVVAAFQRRFRQGYIDGLIDHETFALIEAVHDVYLQGA
ncbi:MAG: N-acetylmuramoyl-L-alanine amidase [Oceanicaulis sp.]